MSLLEIESLSVDLGRAPRVRVLHDVSLRVRPGEVVGIVGESGSGKTTLARAVLRAVDAATGSIRVDGTEVRALRGAALRRWRRAGVAQYVFQDPLRALDPGVRVAESVAEGPRLAGLSQDEIDRRVASALDAVGLDAALAERLPAALSGGQRQRAAIARALAVEPRLLVLDEPVSALDAASRDHVIQALLRLRATPRPSLAPSSSAAPSSPSASASSSASPSPSSSEKPLSARETTADVVSHAQNGFSATVASADAAADAGAAAGAAGAAGAAAGAAGAAGGDDRIGMLVISHDIGSLAALSDRLVVLYRGRVVESGLTREIVSRPRHPYTKLLISSVPVIGVAAPPADERAALRALVDA
ncbi:ABC transporter ATP-binding protein [Microbacterium sp.]|uniref:ABC transporter ATP-binding protein n=1 Tax=Microbacterium sp. TaxID=51671 RepID=UPI0039E2AE21